MNWTGQSKMNRTGASKLEQGQSEHGQWAWQAKMARQAHSLQNKAAAGKHSRRTLRPAQASKKQPADGRPRGKQQQPQTMSACLSPCSAGMWGECKGVCSQEGGLRPTYTVSTPPIAFACHCPYPLP